MGNFKFFTIRGYQKSGTNWLSNVVNRHPEVFSRGEYHLEKIQNAALSYSDNQFRKQFQPELLKAYRASVRRILTHNVKKPDVKWFGDRTPTSLMPRLLPRAKQLFIVRDGRDVMVSQIYHRLRHGHKESHNDVKEFQRIYGKYPFLSDKLELFIKDVNYFEEKPLELLTDENYVRTFARHWSTFIKTNFEFIEKENEKNPDKIMVIRYEDLRSNYESKFVEIMKFFNLNAADALPIDDFSGPGLPRTDNLSLFRKGVSGDWVKHFDDERLTWYMEEAADALDLTK